MSETRLHAQHAIAATLTIGPAMAICLIWGSFAHAAGCAAGGLATAIYLAVSRVLITRWFNSQERTR